MEKSYPALLREAGYRTGFVGKYGVKTEGKPFCLSISFNAVHAADEDKENHFSDPDQRSIWLQTLTLRRL